MGYRSSVNTNIILIIIISVQSGFGNITKSECSTNITGFQNFILKCENSSFCARDRTENFAAKQRIETTKQQPASAPQASDRLNRFFYPPTALNVANIDGLSHSCRIQMDQYRQDLIDFKLWALKMYDSSAKIPSGLLNGNINQYGDFDQCLGIENRYGQSNDDGVLKGQYCLSSIQVTLADNGTDHLNTIYDLIHSYHAIRSRLTDPGHRIPRFSSITWGICAPHKCDPKDLQLILQRNLDLFLDRNKATVKVLVDPYMCQIRNENAITKGTIIVSYFFIFILVIALYATFIDGRKDFIQNEVILSFSLKRTLKSLVSLKRSDNDIKAVHGIRFINAILLIIAHKSMAIFYYPFTNRTEMAKDLGRSWSVVGRAASLYTDPFIMFSGLLTCYSIMGNFRKSKEVSIWKEYINRLFRLIPTLSALILFCTWILPVIGSGPQWPLVVQHHADNCKNYWWRNFLFIHNYFGFEKMCLTHTHHIGIDTQLFLLGVPAILWMETKIQQRSKILHSFIILAVASTVGRFYISYKMDLANFVYYGATVQKMFETADFMYILPMYRFTVYAMGIFLGIILRRPPTVKLTKNHLTIGWLASIGSLYASFFWPMEMSTMDYENNPFHNALFASLAPIGWCFTFAWIIYTTHLGYNNFFTSFLSWRGFLIWTRISYAVYLTQFPIFFYFIGIARTPQYYNFVGTYINWNELFCVLLFSVVITIFFDLPFQKIKTMLFLRIK